MKRSAPINGVETGHRSASVCNLANIVYKLNRTLEWDAVKEKFKGMAKPINQGPAHTGNPEPSDSLTGAPDPLAFN